VIVYAISPRRDPGFIATSSNAGSLVWWATAIPEGAWTRGIGVLAVVLAVNIVLLVWSAQSRQRLVMDQGRSVILTRLVAGIAASVVCVGLAYILWFAMLWYLLVQSIVD
jgi:hypothetical protein